jgi:predicted transcriptional regulator
MKVVLQKTEVKQKKEFEPSMKTIMRIFKSMSEKGSLCKTNLSIFTKLNYARVARHISWMERKGLIESIINDGKVNVVLTPNGRLFNSMISV